MIFVEVFRIILYNYTKEYIIMEGQVKNIEASEMYDTVLNKVFPFIKNLNDLLPSLTLCNLLESKESPEQSRMIFSTYPTMMNAIDEAKNAFGKK